MNFQITPLQILIYCIDRLSNESCGLPWLFTTVFTTICSLIAHFDWLPTSRLKALCLFAITTKMYWFSCVENLINNVFFGFPFIHFTCSSEENIHASLKLRQPISECLLKPKSKKNWTRFLGNPSQVKQFVSVFCLSGVNLKIYFNKRCPELVMQYKIQYTIVNSLNNKN